MSDDTKPPAWFDEGISFECTACGRCCTRTGLVLFEDEDVARISAHLELAPEVFRARFLTYDEGLWFVDVHEGLPCVFLDEQSKCTVHEVKPIQCSSYPFWPELFESRDAWLSERPHCEGIGQGRRYTRDEILARMIE